LPAGALCKLNIINLDDSASSSTAQIYKSFSLQLCETLIWLKYEQKYTHFLSTKCNSHPCIVVSWLENDWSVTATEMAITHQNEKKYLKTITCFFKHT
jgi:hypothetical protein